MKRPNVVCIVPAAGCGRRLGFKKKKPFVLLGGEPIITYPLKVLDGSALIDRIIIASGKDSIKKIKNLVNEYGFSKVTDVIEGGRTRQESVRNCVKIIDPPADIVLIQDAARPFPKDEVIAKSVRLASRFGGCIVGTYEKDTVKLVDKHNFIKKTIDRNMVFRAQTPQVFRYDVIKKAYGLGLRLRSFTDDASLAERIGARIKALEGPSGNIKITTREDLKFAEVLL